MNPGPVRWGRGKGGHSIESKGSTLLEMLKLLELLELLEMGKGASCGSLESEEQRERGQTIGRCPLERCEVGLHN